MSWGGNTICNVNLLSSHVSWFRVNTFDQIDEFIEQVAVCLALEEEEEEEKDDAFSYWNYLFVALIPLERC